MDHATVVLADGDVLVAGGILNNGINPPDTMAELYNPASQSWSPAGSLSNTVAYLGAALTPGGQVVLAGGVGYFTAPDTNIFDPGRIPVPARQPVISSVTAPLNQNGALVATGVGFEVVPEASGGGTANSASNHPIFSVMNLASGQVDWVEPDETTQFSDGLFTSASQALGFFPDGPALVTAFVDGIPSASSVVLVYATTAPYAPLNAFTLGGNTQATVTFSAAFDGTSPITGYTVTSSPADGTDTNAGQPVLSHLVTGLVNGISYTFTVTATNAIGTSPPSFPTASITSNPGMISIDNVTSGTVTETYTAAPIGVTVTVNPGNLPYSVTYTSELDSSYGPTATPPTLPGFYSVTAEITDPDFPGESDTEVLDIVPIQDTGMFHSSTATFNGSQQGVSFSSDLGVQDITYTYTGAVGTTYATTSTPPTAVGTYTVVATIVDPGISGTFYPKPTRIFP